MDGSDGPDGPDVPEKKKKQARVYYGPPVEQTYVEDSEDDGENGKTPSIVENGVLKKRSFIEIMYNKVHPDRNIESSSWYLFCKKVRKKDEEAAADAWEPAHWQSVCPYPFCPTYRQFARLVGLTMVVLLLWGSAFAVLGDTLAPGGDLFSLAVLTVAAHFGGWLVSLTTLPALVGMLLVGILFQNVGLYGVSGDFVEVVSVLRKIALVIILTRAGLDLDPPALRRLLCTVLKIGLIPWVIECVTVAVTMYFFFGMPWIWGFMLGSAVAAVSPAVTVSCLFRLRAKGYGTAKGIPTLIIAISGIDDAVSVAGFGIISSILFSHDSLLYQIIQGPLSVVMGLGFGVLWGILAKYVPERNDPFVVPLRVLMLFGGGLIAVLGSEAIGLGGAGPLAVVAAAFVSCYSWTQQGWEVDDNPVATAFEIFWMIFEPILFGLTGTMIKIDQLDPHTVGLVAGCLFIGFVIRIGSTIPIAYKSGLNTKEKVFVSLSLMAKATVQAALCTVPLDLMREGQAEGSGQAEGQAAGHSETRGHAELFLTTCVVSILLTAPTIAILMTLLGPRLLTKTAVDPEFPENWRRHTRPSLRDISIIDEGDEDDDDNLGKLSRRSSRRQSASIKDKDSAKYDVRSDSTTAAPVALNTTSVP
ncbi:sodium/hydrogen exchanger 9B2 isoform X2 [Thrips palmi]|uniref:Sodium/hydrogen exchanger 9B2 isoform X2 n=1 Tax=Thrips palmi TaxID=161013 RepID=A0A6P8YBW5_THRPL|nr:sodium/hydrogen exchanger 9B2 isoform X2 [Thrips palmi]